MSNPKLLAASAKRDRARARLLDDVSDVKARLSPGALADKAISTAAGQAQKLVWKRPATLATLVGSLGLFVARRQLAKWIGNRHKQRRATRKGDTS